MKTLEEIKNLRERIMTEGYESNLEYDYRFFKGCECMLDNLTEKMSHVLDVAMHTSFKKEELEAYYWNLEKEYNELYESVKPFMEASYNGYKAYSERCYKRYNNVIDYRHGDDYFMNEIAKEAFGK